MCLQYSLEDGAYSGLSLALDECVMLNWQLSTLDNGQETAEDRYQHGVKHLRGRSGARKSTSNTEANKNIDRYASRRTDPM